MKNVKNIKKLLRSANGSSKISRHEIIWGQMMKNMLRFKQSYSRNSCIDLWTDELLCHSCKLKATGFYRHNIARAAVHHIFYQIRFHIRIVRAPKWSRNVQGMPSPKSIKQIFINAVNNLTNEKRLGRNMMCVILQVFADVHSHILLGKYLEWFERRPKWRQKSHFSHRT